MIKTLRSTSRGIWWDGTYGGISKGGQFEMLYLKPSLPDIDKFDSVVCFPDATPTDAYCYTVYHGVQATLNQDHINYLADIIDVAFPSSGGGGGGGVTNLRIDKAGRAIRFTTETGGQGSLPFADLKATPLEFYLDVANPARTVTMPFQQQGVEYTVPIGQVPMSGRSHFMELDRANNRVIVQEGNLRGTIRLYGAFRFSPSVKSAMDLDLLWYYRRAGSSDAWTLIYQGNVKRAESQTTAALSFPTSSGYYDFPDHPVELEVRLRFNDFGDGRGEDVAWSTVPIFTDAGDGLKISLYKEPNYAYTT